MASSAAAPLPAHRRRAAASAVLRLLAALLLAARHAATAPAKQAAKKPEAYVPSDLPGADKARAWLQKYQQRQAAPGFRPAWPEGPVSLPPCRPAAGKQQRASRRHLIFASVGDSWDPRDTRNRWLDELERASSSFDLVVSYYGNVSSWDCPACLHVFRGLPRAKWRAIFEAVQTPEWASLVGSKDYGYVWLPDDDLVASACTIAQFFSLLEQHQLVLAQMSVCRRENQSISWPHLYQRPETALRYVGFVEIMGPALSFDFFQSVGALTTVVSYTGYGLDTVWPFLLGFPPDGVALVDAVCMGHLGRAGPNSESGGKQSLYKTLAKSPYMDTKHEASAVLAYWHVTDAAVEALDMPAKIQARAAVEMRAVPLARPASRTKGAAGSGSSRQGGGASEPGASLAAPPGSGTWSAGLALGAAVLGVGLSSGLLARRRRRWRPAD